MAADEPREEGRETHRLSKREGDVHRYLAPARSAFESTDESARNARPLFELLRTDAENLSAHSQSSREVPGHQGSPNGPVPPVLVGFQVFIDSKSRFPRAGQFSKHRGSFVTDGCQGQLGV